MVFLILLFVLSFYEISSPVEALHDLFNDPAYMYTLMHPYCLLDSTLQIFVDRFMF